MHWWQKNLHGQRLKLISKHTLIFKEGSPFGETAIILFQFNRDFHFGS
jgi:hypothetical protein